MTSLLLLSAVVICLMIGVPIGFALMIPASLVIAVAGGNLLSVPMTLFSGSASFLILAVPLFILMGELMSSTSIADRMTDLARALVGWLRGGLAHVNVLAGMFMAEMSGSSVADAAAISKIFVPQMERLGYARAFAATVSSASGSLGIIVPPSIAMVLYGALTNTSIRDLFIAGIVPGFFLGLGFLVVNYFFARVKKFPIDQKFEFPRLVTAARRAVIPMLIPVMVVGGLIFGVFTPTEAAAIGVMIALVFGFATRELTFSTLYKLLARSSYQTAAVMIIVAGAAVFGQLLANDQVPQAAAAFIVRFAHTPVTFLLLVNLLLLVTGMFLHAVPAIILIVPILMPLAHQFGIDPVHFGIVVCFNLAVGQQIPPTASVLLTVCGVSNVKMQDTFPYLVWYILAMLIELMLITYIPFMSIWFLT